MATPPDIVDLESFQGKDPQQALDAALAQVRSHCGWHVAPSQSDTVSIWSNDGRTLLLPTLNLTAVTSVTQDATVVSSANYTFESYGVIQAALGVCFSRLTKATVVFTHGFAETPADVAAVILSLAQRYLNDSRGLVVRPGSATSATASQLIETYGPVLTDADKEKLAPYVIPGLG